MGQLKRIQQVLHENWKDDNRFENINWQEKIDFIKKGKGNLFPVYLTVDFSIENPFLKLQHFAFNTNIIHAKKNIELTLKYLILQEDYN